MGKNYPETDKKAHLEKNINEKTRYFHLQNGNPGAISKTGQLLDQV